MSDIKPTPKPTAAAKTAKENTELLRYIDALIANQKTIALAMENTRQQGIRLSDAVAKRVSKNQDEALKLAKKLSLSPTAYKDNVTAIMEAAVNTQTQSIDIFKEMLAEQTEMREEFRATSKSLFDGTREVSKAALELTKAWATKNPVADVVKQSFDSAKTAANKFAGKLYGEEMA